MIYSDSNRGSIQNRKQAKQIINFNGLRYGRITPTDIDGYWEYHGIAFIFLEYKFNTTNLPDGQQLSYERLVDALEEAGKLACCLVCRHLHDVGEDIEADEAQAVKYYQNHKWTFVDGRQTVKQFTDRYMKLAEEKERQIHDS